MHRGLNSVERCDSQSVYLYKMRSAARSLCSRHCACPQRHLASQATLRVINEAPSCIVESREAAEPSCMSTCCPSGFGFWQQRSFASSQPGEVSAKTSDLQQIELLAMNNTMPKRCQPQPFLHIYPHRQSCTGVLKLQEQLNMV